MKRYKLAMKNRQFKAASFEVTKGVFKEGAFLLLDEEDAAAALKEFYVADIIYDSYKDWPADAPLYVKSHDYAMGPGYWERKMPTMSEEGPLAPSAPPQHGPRLLVLGLGLSPVEDASGPQEVIVKVPDDKSLKDKGAVALTAEEEAKLPKEKEAMVVSRFVDVSVVKGK